MWLGSHVVVKSSAATILVDHECLCLGCSGVAHACDARYLLNLHVASMKQMSVLPANGYELAVLHSLCILALIQQVNLQKALCRKVPCSCPSNCQFSDGVCT